ncbi:MAG: response regulator [Bacteroidota bacterium]|nr:response regulator [Bacteroidota bacterium]
MKGEPVDILIVEDNPSDLKLMIKALQKNNLGNKLITLKDGEEALDFLFSKGQFEGRDISNRPKVIFLDLKLPKIDGLEVLQAIKSNELTKVIPVIIVTSSKEEKDVVESYNLGVNSYIVKPVEFDVFVDVISHLGLYWVVMNEPPF